MSRNRLFLVAFALTAASMACLIFEVSLQRKNIRSFITSHYQEYSRDAGGTRHLCTGVPAEVADTLAAYQRPAAQADDAGTQFLRYDDAIVSVGQDGTHPCGIRVEDLAARLQPWLVHFPRTRLLPRVTLKRVRRQHGRPRRNQMTRRH